METGTRPLGTVAQLLEELGHEISYAYDDPAIRDLKMRNKILSI